MKIIFTCLFCFLSLLQAEVEYEYPIDHGGVIQDSVSSSENSTTVFTFHVTEDQTVSRIRLRFAASHAFIADIQVVLKAPDGTLVRIFDGIGWDGGLFMNTYLEDVVFQDSASEDIGRSQLGADSGTDIGPWSGSYRPEEQGEVIEHSLSAFQGVSAQGVWQLIVTDYDRGDSGYVYAQGENTNLTPSARARFGNSLGTSLLVQFSTALSPIAQWRADHFGTPASSGDGASSVDFDQDGLINLLEYALGRDPKSGQSKNGLASLPVNKLDSPSHQMIISLDLPLPVPEDVLYRIMSSDNLLTWNEMAHKSGVASWVVSEGVLSPIPLVGGRQRVELAVDVSGQSKRWLRLEILGIP